MGNRKKYKLLLINPLNTRRKGLIRNPESIYPPLSLGIIAALTPDHWEVELLDENFEPFRFIEADLVGFTALTSSVNRAYELSQIYRKNNIKTVIGGIHVSMLPDEALQYADIVVKGEVESVWKEVISDFTNNRLKSVYEGKWLPMVNQPLPRINMFHPGYAFGSLQTTRGCPMNCEFCSVHTFNGSHYRPRPVDEVIEEYSRIKQKNVYFVDDNLSGYGKKSADRIIEICKGIIDKGIKKDWFCSASMNIGENEDLLHYMSEAGCKMIFLGIESELIDQLEASNKKTNLKIGIDNFDKVYNALHRHGIAVLGAFIFGLESDTPEKIINRAKYILNSGVDAMQTTILTPLPGTALYNRFVKENRLIYTNYPIDWEKYSFAEVVFKPSLMEVKEFENAVHEAWSLIYDAKTLKRKMMATLKSTRSAVAATWAYTSNIQYHNLIFEDERKHLHVRDIFYNQ